MYELPLQQKYESKYKCKYESKYKYKYKYEYGPMRLSARAPTTAEV